MGIHEIDAAADGMAVICLNASGNTLDSGAGTINLNEIGATSVINVSQLAPTAAVIANELDDANGIKSIISHAVSRVGRPRWLGYAGQPLSLIWWGTDEKRYLVAAAA